MLSAIHYFVGRNLGAMSEVSNDRDRGSGHQENMDGRVFLSIPS